ncbi:MAG TPA: DUF2779 domain-containing protein [Oligoflexia bacterium]|nr:DUF2779 domain-containing protein [Oligoflexia bacterium]HMP49751.1 DUF2779 domain-containing protein [Oligoflexia bacterium]
MLTKSNYFSAHQCHKRIWLEKNADLLTPPQTKSEQKRINEGNRVGELARAARGEGILIKGLNWEDALTKTSEAIKNGAERIFEAAFRFENYAVRLDILEKVESGWNLYEVKASTSRKPEHISDVAFQKFVIERSGIQIVNCFVVLLNRNYKLDCKENLFVYENVDEEVREYIEGLESELKEIDQILESEKCPDVHVSSHCKKPDKCSFYENCWKDIPKKSIFSIPRLNANKEASLIADGVIDIKHISPDFELSSNQKKYADSVVTGLPQIDKKGIKNKLTELSFPIYFFDVESHQTAVPALSGVNPYSQICFQFSCHILKESGEIDHCEYLHVENSDPRVPFLEKLFQVIGESGSIVVYNQQFEITRFKELAIWFPEYKEKLYQLIGRVWDQMIIFRDYYTHPDFNGSNSIKSILPVLVPKLSYKDLVISQGDEASAIWSEMIYMEDGEEKQKIIHALKEYCKLDTLAMVEIHKILWNIVSETS